MICPNINIKEVKDGFNEIVVALGGKPLTDEEFRSSELRNQRQGVDFAAMEATYKVYHRNNGNMLDLAPNGEHSVLFESLLDYYNGDRAKAIVAKSKVYSDEFFNWFGDWTVAESEDIPYQLISHLRRSNINVYGKYRMQLYLRKYSDKLVLLFIGKKKRELFKKQLIKARPDLDSTFILNGISFIHEPFHNQGEYVINAINLHLHSNTLLGKSITTDFENRDFFITTFTNVALPDDILQMIKDGLLKKSSRQEGYYDLTEKGIKQANISQDVFTIFDLIERGLAEYKSGDIYLTDKGKSEGQAQYKEIDSILDFLHSLEDDKENSVYISTAIRWIVNRSITLPEDHEKAYQAFKLARKKHLDLLKYNTLGELIAAPEMLPKDKKKKPFDPDKAKTFSNKRTVTTPGGRVFTVYDVENTEEGQREVCKALAAHYEMSPWCLSTFTSTGEPTESAKRYWGYYNAIPRKIAYENGKPVAFSSDRALSRSFKIFRGREVYYSRLSGGYVIDNLTLADGLPLIDEGVVKFTKDLDFILTAKGEEELKSPDDNREAWWDMEDRHPQETLSDSIVSEQKSMLRGDADLFDGPEPFEPDPFDLYLMDVHNAIRGIVNEYILNYLRDWHLVPDGLNEIWVRNILTDRYILNNGDINDAILLSVNNIHNNTPNEIALGILGRLNIFDNIRNTIRDELQDLPQPAPAAPEPVPPVPIAPLYNEPAPGDDDYLLPFFMTPNGEVYGFVTPNNDIYLDEEIISPQHPIHEYTHIWDRMVAKKNPELWKRGVELMKQTSIWDEILNDDNYGKKWSVDESISKSQLEFLIASEVHSRLVGENGESIINDISKEKGSKDIVNKLRQWLLDFWKSLKSTFSNFSDEELQKLTIEDFNMMTVRDFVELNDENNVSKVVDENGEPLMVWHGSKEKFTTFNKNTKNRGNLTSIIKKGFYFSNKNIASQYASSKAKEDLFKYMEYEEGGFSFEEIAEAFGFNRYDDEELEKAATYIMSLEERTADFSNNLYAVFLNIKNPVEVDLNGKYIGLLNKTQRDAINNSEGAIIKNVDETTSRYRGEITIPGMYVGTDYIVFDPNQIKSATDNIQDEARGVSGFSTENDDIQKTVLSESEYNDMIDEMNLDQDKTDSFLYNFITKILRVNPRKKVDSQSDSFNFELIKGGVGVNFERIEDLAKKIFGFYSEIDMSSKEKFEKNIDDLLDDWSSRLMEEINNPMDMSSYYTARNKTKDNIKLLLRFLDHNLRIEDFNEDEQQLIRKLTSKPDGSSINTKQGVGYQLKKLKDILITDEQSLAKAIYIRSSILIAAKNRLVALNTINNLKQLVKQRLLAEYESYLPTELQKQNANRFENLVKSIEDVINSKNTDQQLDGVFKSDVEHLISYEDFLDTILESYPEYSDLIKIFKNANPKLKIIIGVKPTEEVAGIVPGWFSPKSNTLYISKMCDIYTCIHELAHSATYYGMMGRTENTEAFSSLIEKFIDYIRDFIKQNKLNPSMFESMSLMGMSLPALIYGFTNPSEFIAELFGNPKFQELLQLIPAMENKQFKSLFHQIWDTIVDFLNNLLGNNKVQKTALDQAKILGLTCCQLQQQHIDEIYAQLNEIQQNNQNSLVFRLYYDDQSSKTAFLKNKVSKLLKHTDFKLKFSKTNDRYAILSAKRIVKDSYTFEELKDVIQRFITEAGGSIEDFNIYPSDYNNYSIVVAPKQGSNLQKTILNNQEESPYSVPIFHDTEVVQQKKSYVSPTTQRKDIITSEDLMSSSTQTPKERIKFNLEDNSSSNITSQSERQRDYLDKIADKLLSAFNILARSYERDIQTKSASRQRTKNKVHEIINKLQELRGVQAITEAVEWGLVNMGPSVKVGEYVNTKTITGFLYQKKQDTDGKFTGLTPEQLYDIYRNGIGFYEKTLLPLLPGDTDLNYGRETIQKINDLKASVAQAKELWAQAMQIVGRRIIDGAIQDLDGIPQDVKDDMKQVAYDWLTTNSYYGDISVFQEYTANFGLMENPIIRIAFNLILRAETATNEAIHPIAAALTKAYRKADFTPKRWFKSNWLKALMEVDKDGIPTGNFVRDINYGLYDKDLADFVNTLISDWEDDFGFHYIRDEYGYIVRSDTGERVEELEWIGDKMPNWYLYQLEIERWKADHANKMYTFDYYKERMSKPYRGFEDPALISSTSKLDGHGLSPKTLAAYTRILSNINLYLNACSDEETGMAHPEELDPQDKLKLDEWYDALDNLSNPYNADGTIKDEEDRIIAFELRAWQRWIGERTETRIDQLKFDEEVKKVTERSIKENNPRLLEDFYRYNTYTGIHPDYFATTIGRFSEARMEDIDVVQARLIKSSLQNLIKSKNGYTREIGLMENNPQFFLECKRTDQLIADGRAKSSPEFAKEFEQSFYSAMIPYLDEFGNYRTKSGTSITDISGIDHRELMSFWDYLKGKYIDMAKMYGTIPGLVDNNGVPIPITGTDEEIAEKVEELLTYVDTRKNEFGEYIQEVKPLSIFSMIMPSVDVFKHPQTGRLTPTITQIPRGRFAEKSDRTGKYINRDFNKADNHAEQPKRRFYDNSKAMQRLEEDGLKEVYDECIKYMQESYKKHSPSTRRYDYQLPKMNADDAAIASRMFAKGFRKTASDLWHSMNEVQPNDYGMLSENDRIKSPDGTIGTQLPLRYVGKLEDPSTYTTDIVGAVIMYAHMAENYKNKLEIEAQLNTLMYNLDPENRSQDAKDDSKSLNAFRAMMNSGLYDNQWDLGSNYDTKEPSVYKTAAQNIAASTGTFALGGLMGGVSLGIPVAIAGGAATSIFGPMAIGLGVGAVLGLGTGIISQLSGKVASNKFARMFQRTESLQMLGFNILSMSVGFADAVIKMTRDSIAGKYMTVRDLATGVGYFVLNFPKVVSNIGNPLANCKLVAMMQMNNVSKDTRRIYNNMNYGRTRKLINNICLGGFSMLDYGANCILLKSYYNNIRFYNGNTSLGIKPGWYSKYELKQAFIDAGGSNLDAEIAYFRCNETLWDAYWYDSENSTTLLKDEYKDPSNERFVPLKLRNRVRTKTVQRGALYNGMNPDNDIPLYKRSIYGSAVGAMRGWLTQLVQHLMYGLDDTSIREFEETVEQKNTDTRGVLKLNKIKVRKPRTDLQNSRRMTWNYETGLPQDEILHGLRRSFSTLFKKALYAFKGIKDHNAKLSYVEKYAWKDTIVTLGLTAMLMVGWIPVHDWAKSAVKPENREQAGATGPVDAVTRYIPLRFIRDGVYKLFLDDLYFRTIESQLTGFDPKTAADILNALTVYKSAFEEHTGIIQGVGDAFGVTGHDLSEVINRGSYKYYTRGEKLLYKTLSLGQLDNLHTAFSYNGLQQNLNFYYHQYGWIYKAFGYDDFKNETAKKSTSKFGSKDFGKSGFGSKDFGSKKF